MNNIGLAFKRVSAIREETKVIAKILDLCVKPRMIMCLYIPPINALSQSPNLAQSRSNVKLSEVVDVRKKSIPGT